MAKPEGEAGRRGADGVATDPRDGHDRPGDAARPEGQVAPPPGRRRGPLAGHRVRRLVRVGA